MANKNFNIKETVNKNIEKNQFPSFANHRSLVGWCSMNYPKVLSNPIYMQKPQNLPDQKLYDLNNLFQQKNPVERQRPDFVKPFTNLPESKTNDDDNNPITHHSNSKQSSLTLATTKHAYKAQIFQKNNIISEQYSAVKPLKCILGPDKDGDYSRKVRQIGQVYYNPPNESQQMRHLKKLPNTIVNEQNLLVIMDNNLRFLDLQYKTDISNDLINKVGYLAPNIKELVLVATKIDNNVLIQLGKSCKHLEAIDISLCQLIEENAIISFLKNTPHLKKFGANHSKAFTDACLDAIKNHKQLSVLEINFCYEVTSAGIQALQGIAFQELGLSSLPNVKADDFAKIIETSANKLQSLNLSFNNSAEVGAALMLKISSCSKLVTLILTGCQFVKDEGINNLYKGKQGQAFGSLTTLKLGGLKEVSDNLHHFLKKCPLLAYLQVNNLEKLTDNFLQNIKGLPNLKTVMLNFTPNISDQKLKDIRENQKQIKFMRNIIKMTDPADDGLRMPIPLASIKPKKKKKDKKK